MRLIGRRHFNRVPHFWRIGDVRHRRGAPQADALAETGLRRVVLSGGALQNRLLERGLVARLGAETVVMARDVPVNDGGLALGQAWAAVLALTEPASAAVDRAAGLAREDEPA